MCIYIDACKLMKMRLRTWRKARGVNERVWREEKEWRDDAIISSKKRRNN